MYPLMVQLYAFPHTMNLSKDNIDNIDKDMKDLLALGISINRIYWVENEINSEQINLEDILIDTKDNEHN